MSAVDKDKIIAMLGAGVRPGQVAAAVGCDISYVSQLLNDDQIAQEIAAVRTKDLLKHKSVDDTYDEIEAKLQEKLKDILPYVTKPDQVIRALQFVNGAKRRAAVGIGADIESGEIVKLNLPNVTVNNYKITINGSMVEVGGRSLTPLPSAVLLKSLEQANGASNDAQKKVPRLVGESDASRFPSENVIHEGKI